MLGVFKRLARLQLGKQLRSAGKRLACRTTAGGEEIEYALLSD